MCNLRFCPYKDENAAHTHTQKSKKTIPIKVICRKLNVLLNFFFFFLPWTCIRAPCTICKKFSNTLNRIVCVCVCVHVFDSLSNLLWHILDFNAGKTNFLITFRMQELMHSLQGFSLVIFIRFANCNNNICNDKVSKFLILNEFGEQFGAKHPANEGNGYKKRNNRRLSRLKIPLHCIWDFMHLILLFSKLSLHRKLQICGTHSYRWGMCVCVCGSYILKTPLFHSQACLYTCATFSFCSIVNFSMKLSFCLWCTFFFLSLSLWVCKCVYMSMTKYFISFLFVKKLKLSFDWIDSIFNRTKRNMIWLFFSSKTWSKKKEATETTNKVLVMCMWKCVDGI